MSSEVKRYDPINSDSTCGMCAEDADYGAYVEYADYATLHAEAEALRAENARLRGATSEAQGHTSEAAPGVTGLVEAQKIADRIAGNSKDFDRDIRKGAGMVSAELRDLIAAHRQAHQPEEPK